MSRKLNPGRLVAKPSLVPYTLTGLALSLLCAFQFGEIAFCLSIFGMSMPGVVHQIELLACVMLFFSFVLFWSITSYSASSVEISSGLLLLKKNSIHVAYIRHVKVERKVADMLMGTRSVSFVSAQGRVLMHWHFVRFDDDTARFVRRLGLLLSADVIERTGSRPDAS